MIKPEKIQEMIDKPIFVGDVQFSFSDYIDNEIISKFPEYSQRMRSTFVKASKLVDNYLNDLTNEFNNLESKYENMNNEKKREIENSLNEYKQLLEQYKTNKENELNQILQYKVNQYLNFMETAKSTIHSLMQNSIATENRAGLISESRVREISPKPEKLKKMTMKSLIDFLNERR